MRFLEPMQAALVSNRRKVPPFGLHGGAPGICGDQWIERTDGSREQLEGRCRAEVGRGEVFTVQTPSGGGFGSAGK
jgi:N-methylhydantoinase B/oxoprolinase/acetone carboxylase alpha subunit